MRITERASRRNGACQRRRAKHSAKPAEADKGLLFPSELGWIALQVRDGKISRLQFGLPTAAAAKRAIAAISGDSQPIVWGQPDRREQAWIEELQQYAAGQPVRLAALPLDESGMTPFQLAVRAACRRLKRGEILTYGELARRVAHPGAARAVGSVMSRNPTPLIVPCHRVLGTSGLGGYSAPQGLAMKLHLLALEGAIAHLDCDCEHC